MKKLKSLFFGPRADGTSVSPLLPLVLAALTTAALARFVIPGLQDTYVGGLFANHGWVPVAILLLTCWAGIIAVFKLGKLRRQWASLSLPEVHDLLREPITRRNVEHLGAKAEELEGRYPGSFLLGRVKRAMELFRAKGTAQDVPNLLASQAELDGVAAESSYSIVKTCIWAVPILGFIGTVIGIGEAVRGLSETVGAGAGESLEVILSKVTGGLGTAFETTLIALCVSIVLMLPTNWLEKIEDDLLIQVGDFCNRELLPRFDEEQTDDLAEDLRRTFAEVVEKQEGLVSLWSDQLQNVASSIVTQAQDAWEQVGGELAERQQEHAKAFHEAIHVALEAQHAQMSKWTDQLESVGTTLTERVAQGLQDTHEEMVRTSQDMLTQGTALLESASLERRAFKDEILPAYARHSEQLSGITSRLDAFASAVGTEVEKAWQRADERMRAERSADAARQHEQHAGVVDALTRIAGKLEATTGEQRTIVNQLSARMSDAVESVQGRIEQMQERSTAEFSEATRELSRSLVELQSATADVAKEQSEMARRRLDAVAEDTREFERGLTLAVNRIGGELGDTLASVASKLETALAAPLQRMQEIEETLGASAVRFADLEKVSVSLEGVCDSMATTLPKAFRNQLKGLDRVTKNTELLLRRQSEINDRATTGLSALIEKLQAPRRRWGFGRNGHSNGS